MGPQHDGTFLWVWSQSWQLMEVRRVTATEPHLQTHLEQEFIHAGPTAYIDDHVALISHDYGTSGGGGSGGSESLYYYHADHMACTLALTDATGQIVERYLTDAYGKATVYNADWSGPRGESTVGNPFRHQGLAREGATGGYYNRYRHVCPEIGSFLSRDPMQYWSSLSLYEYLSSAPLGRIDPDGLRDDAAWESYYRRRDNLPADERSDVDRAMAATALSGCIVAGTLAYGGPPVIDAAAKATRAIVGVAKLARRLCSPANKDKGRGGQPGGGVPSPRTTVASGEGRAGKTGPPNSIYEQVDKGGNVQSRTFYDDNGRSFCRQDFSHGHGGMQPHQHNRGFDSTGRPISSDNVGPVPPGYSGAPTPE